MANWMPPPGAPAAPPQAPGYGAQPPGYGTPAPCMACGAPMHPGPVRSLHQTPEWICSYCGHREALPADAAELHRHLRLRLLQLQRARETSEAPLKTFEALRQIYPAAVGIMALMGLWQGSTFVQLVLAKRAVDPSQYGFALLPIGLAVGMLTGWLGMRRAFLVQLRPLLRARPPRQQGLAARCRTCGGDLPPVRAPEAKCSYCGASNVLDEALTRDASALLAAEAAQYSQRAQGWTQDPAVYMAPARAFYLFGGIGAAVTVVLGLGITLLFLQ